MKVLKRNFCMSVIALGLIAWQPSSTFAAGAWNGSTESTQIANNLILGGQFSEQLRQTATQIQMYRTMVTNLKTAAQSTINTVTQPVRDVVSSVAELQASYNELQNSVKEVGTMWQRRNKEMINWGENPKEYFRKEKILAESRGGQYKKQWDSDIAAGKKLATRAKAAQDLAASIPGIEGNVQGLQILNSQINIVASGINDMLTVIQKDSVNKLQDRMDVEEAKSIEAERNMARIDAMKAAAIRAQNYTSGYKAPWEK
jgi:type IV secretion system protein TrbJ